MYQTFDIDIKFISVNNINTNKNIYLNSIDDLILYTHKGLISEIQIYKYKLNDLNILSEYTNLTKLWCIDNQLISLSGLENCVNLTYLNCNYNRLTSLIGLEKCINLMYLYCDNNRLISLNGLNNCINLKRLECNNNKLIYLTELENCIDLEWVMIDNNPELLLHFRKLIEIINNNHIYSENEYDLKNINNINETETPSSIIDIFNEGFYDICEICLKPNNSNIEDVIVSHIHKDGTLYNHYFHQPCINKWLENNLTLICPVCRSFIE